MTQTLTAPRGGRIPDPEQREMALALANCVRLARARLKQKTRALPQIEGVALVADIASDPPDFAERMRVHQLLVSIVQWGDQRSARLLRRAGISPMRTFGGLTARQRTELVSELRDAFRAADLHREAPENVTRAASR